MHEAYKAIPVYEKMPLNIESVAVCNYDVYGKKKSEDGKLIAKVLVGTKVGHLFVFKINANVQYARGVESMLERNCRSFSKKPILQLFATNELNLIISLSEGVISIHHLDSFNRITSLAKTKGATYFSADLESQVSSTGAAAHALKLCVAVRRNLQFYFWKNGEFCELHADVQLPEVPKTLAWCRDSICVGLKREYLLVKLNDENPVRDLSPTGKISEPVMSLVHDNMIAVLKDEDTVFVNSNGDVTYKLSFTWSESPIALCSQPPYLLSVMAKYIEVRTMEPRIFIQSIDIQKPKMVKCYQNWVIVASANSIWLLQQLPFSKQLPALLNSREYELALQLAKLSDEESAEEKEKTVQNIEILNAFDKFRQRRFEESLHSFANLSVDPSQVIGLFPDMLPEKQSNKIKYPDPVTRLKGTELEEGLIALSEYLTLKRNEMLKVTTSTVHNLKPIVAKNEVIKSRKSLLQIIDTTLLKCYLKTNNALVGPLLRLPENYCHLEEAERILKKMNKTRELTELYKRKGLHRKALDLLLTQHQEQGITMELVEYLQHLGNNHLELVFHFAEEILESNPRECLKVFTGDTTEVESLPRRQVFDFLDLRAGQLVKPYLEHLIFSLEDETETFHNQLALIYKDHVMQLTKELNLGRPDDTIVIVDDDLDMNEESAELVQAKSKLQSFLEVSTSYEPQRLLSEFPLDCLLEERAVILGRQGSHEQALAIYIYHLHDSDKAESYCQRVHNESPEKNKDVFLSLFKMYLQTGQPQTDESNLKIALKILHKHATKIDALQALTLLPNTTSMSDIEDFVCKTLETQSRKRHQLQVLKSLLVAESYQIHEKRIYYDNISCCVTEDRTCCVCKKKIGESAFARYPNDVIVHYFCCKDRRQLPT